jgi:type I restriction enzyme S subunit
MKRIGHILTRNKTPVLVRDDVTYKQVTIRTNYKGVVLRGSQNGSSIGTKNQSAVSAGQFILSRIDARNGAFGIVPEELEGAIVTNDFLAFDINEEEVEREFFNVFLQAPQFLEACMKASRGNTNRKRVDEDFFLNYQVNLPPLAEQHEIIKQINKGRTKLAAVSAEITHQQSLLAKLKQAILQEAIQGKLTADWRAAHPDAEPASQLLHRIQAEKARLIAAKKLRPEKPLPKITPAEIPFDIPMGWEWCRMSDINMKFLGGEAYQSGSILPSGTNQVVRIGNIKPDTLELSKRPAFISDYLAEETSGSRLQLGDILVTMTGTYQKKDYCYSVLLTEEHFVAKQLYQNQRVGCFRLHPEVHNPFLIRALKLAPLLDPVFESSTGAANQANISKGALLNILIPLPPLAEQAAIVERVEALMTTCSALEAEIEQSSTHAAHLLQAVLKEAFAPAAA